MSFDEEIDSSLLTYRFLYIIDDMDLLKCLNRNTLIDTAISISEIATQVGYMKIDYSIDNGIVYIYGHDMFSEEVLLAHSDYIVFD